LIVVIKNTGFSAPLKLKNYVLYTRQLFFIPGGVEGSKACQQLTG